jgi:hypothetical protein
VQRISTSGPVTVSNSQVPVAGGTISVPVNRVDGTDAYSLVLTPQQQTPPGSGQPTSVDASAFTFTGTWGQANGVSDMFDGTANWSATAGSTAVLHFNGTSVALHAVKDVDQGILAVQVDGAAETQVDDYAATRNASGTVWTSGTLPAGDHTMTVRVTGNRNPASAGTVVALDYAVVTPAGSAQTASIDGPAFTYAGTWGQANGVSDMFGGTANWSSTTGSTAVLQFTGTSVALHAVKDVDQGILAVHVDGSAETQVDDYAATRNASGTVWTSGTLPAGNHTMTVRVTGNRNPASAGNVVAVDYAVVTS